MNAITLNQLPSLLLPLVQYFVASLPPTIPPGARFAADIVVRILQSFVAQPGQPIPFHGPNRPMSMPAHVPDLPPQHQWNPEGIKAWVESQAG